MNYWINFAFSMVFGLVQEGIIPKNEYRRFRKLALRICAAMPPGDFGEFIEDLDEKRVNQWAGTSLAPAPAPAPAEAHEALPAADPADAGEPAGSGPAAPAATPVAVFCPDCGATVEAGTDTCPGCGWQSTRPWPKGGTEVSAIDYINSALGNEKDPS